MSGIDGLTHTFSNFQVFDTSCEVAIQSMDTMTGLSGRFSYARNCYIRAVMQPGPPNITEIFYRDKVFELKWFPPSDPNGFIFEYVIMLVNSSSLFEADCNDACDPSASVSTTIRVSPETFSYIKVFEVTESTCFCATVTASNSVGSTPSRPDVFWYRHVIPPPMQPNTDPDDDDDDDVPIVAIILAVVLVAVMIATVILGLVLCKMYLLARESNGSEKPKAYS